MAQYDSNFTGQHNDGYEDRIAALEDAIIAQSNTITTLTNRIIQLENERNNIIYYKGYYQRPSGGGGEVAWTSSKYISFNQKVADTKNCYTAPFFIVPEDGVYFCSFSYFVSDTSKLTSGRPTLFHLTGSNVETDAIQLNQQYTVSVSSLYQCQAGDKLAAGSIDISYYPLSFYGWYKHNEFMVVKLK